MTTCSLPKTTRNSCSFPRARRALLLPDQTTLVPAAAFSRCSSLSRLLVGDSATFTSYDGILYSKDMKTLVACPAGVGASIVIPAETETIDKDALAGCKDLASITALGTVQKIDPTAFTDETKATAVVALPAGQDYEARKATWEQAGFKNFAEPAKPGSTTNQDSANEATGLTYTLLDDYTLSVSWQGKDDPEADLEIPVSTEINGVPYRVSTIAENAFANRGSLTSIKLPTTITTINNGAFAGCANLSTIEFPNTLREIGERAFEATSLKDIWLPASIESIGSRAFASCSSLNRMVALGTPEVASDVLAGCTNVSIYIPSGSEDSWNPGLPADGNHLMPYGITLSEEPLAIEAGQEANLLEGGSLEVPDPIEASYSYAAAPLSVDAGTVSAKKAGTSDITAILTLDDVELTRATRTVEVSPNPNAEADIALFDASTSLPGAYLANPRDLQINVSAPTQVILGEGSGYDVATKPDCATGSAVFKNNSVGLAVQLDSIACENTSTESFIETNDPARSLDTQSIFSLYPQNNEGAAVDFGYGAGVNNVTLAESDKAAFGMGPESWASYTFRLNLTNDLALANAQVIEGVANGSSDPKPLATVMCTFESFTFKPSGNGTKNADFYLEDISVTPNQIYSLDDVKTHAKDISRKGTGSLYYDMYAAFATDDTKYVCKSTWNDGRTYDLRIIGVFHDDKISGSKAGLTFQFKNLFGTEGYQMNSYEKTNAGGWGTSELRANMNPGIDIVPYGEDTNTIWSQVPEDLQNSIEVVKKKYQPDSQENTSTTITSNDKLFLASYSELVEASYWASDYPWSAQEGTQYAYWHGKVDQNNNVNECLKKVYQKDAEAAASSVGVIWWERSVNPNTFLSFLRVNSEGNPGDNNHATSFYGVCPCFCL